MHVKVNPLVPRFGCGAAGDGESAPSCRACQAGDCYDVDCRCALCQQASADSDYTVTSLREQVTDVLSVGEVAAALAASDMPTERVPLTREEEIAYAVQGLTRIGADGAREHDRRARNLNERYLFLIEINGGEIADEDPIAQRLAMLSDQLWGGSEREDRAMAVAWSLKGLYGRDGDTAPMAVAA